MKIMFIDESGHHNLDPKKSDPTYPIFVLVGCIFDEKYYKEEVLKKVNDLKTTFFGSSDIILHTLEMTRPGKTKERRYDRLNDSEIRVSFYQSLNTLLGKLEFRLVSCVIKKSAHLEKYGTNVLDPYLLSFNVLLDDFIAELSGNEMGKIIAEKRQDGLDNQLELAWLNLRINGTEEAKGSEIKEKVEILSMIPKSANEIGLQIADLVATPIGRYVLQIPRKFGHGVEYSVLEEKLRSKGLTILPK